MNTNLRTGILSLAVLLVGGGLVACTSQAVTPGGTGGSGVATGGSGGTGTTGTGGSAGGYVTSDGVLCPLPAKPLITDFTYVADGGMMDQVHFGDDSTTFSGSEFVYPTAAAGSAYPLTSNVTGGSWHMTGTLGDYSGFGLSFDNCSRVDASAYKGISFTISGSVPMGNMITIGMATLNDRIAASWLMSHGNTTAAVGDPGRCIPTSGTNQYSQTTCADPTKTVPVTSTPTTISILWGDFTGGKPEAGVTPGDITTIYGFFPPPAGAGTTTPTTYAVDITIDNLSFIAQ